MLATPNGFQPCCLACFFSFSFAFLLLFHLLLFSAACKSGEKQLAVLIEDALLQAERLDIWPFMGGSNILAFAPNVKGRGIEICLLYWPAYD
ncbi:hypothetical protein PO909_026404 [Leuciscus waleckii]